MDVFDLADDDPTEWFQKAYREGTCHSFTLALHERYGWDVALVSQDEGGMPFHSVAVRPDGRLVDAGGVGDAQSLARYYGLAAVHVRRCTPDAVFNLSGPDPWEMEAAHAFLERLTRYAELAADGGGATEGRDRTR